MVGYRLSGSTRRGENGVVWKTRTENVVNNRRFFRIVLSIEVSRWWGGRRRGRSVRIEKGQLHALLAAARSFEATIATYALKSISIVADEIR